MDQTNPFDGLWLPLEKSEEAVHGEQVRLIRGIASTEDRDEQGETILAAGIDFEPFIKSGYFNWNHSHAPEDIIGEPWEARMVQNEFGLHGSGLLVKGRLYEGSERADHIWNLMSQMEKGVSRRRLGFSVEGLCQRGAGGIVHNSIVEHVAVTHQPVNASTWAQIAKSLVKAMTTETAAPLRTEDLYGHASKLFGGRCDCGERSANGHYHNGRRGAVTHLVKCCGYSADQAAQAITKLHRSHALH